MTLYLPSARATIGMSSRRIMSHCSPRFEPAYGPVALCSSWSEQNAYFAVGDCKGVRQSDF
jgi:hypothetical protein